jgi:DMSO/TMAO reductase YedYZ molybdopterin-dependent catalytic subunit
VPRRLTNLLLLVLSALLAASGLLGWIVPGTQAGVWYDLHRLLGVGLLVVLVWKVPIARSSLHRRLRRPGLPRSPAPGLQTAVPGLLTGGIAIGALVLGVGWTVGLLDPGTFGGYSPLNVHVQLGLLLLPLLVWHLSRRWERKPALISLARRRVLVQLAGLAVASVVGWRLAEAVAARAAPDGSRRASGSKHAGSFTGNACPETIWLFDSVPALSADTWTLTIGVGGATVATVDLHALAALPRVSSDEILDCTGGWWSEQRWSGWRVADVLALAKQAMPSGLVQLDRSGGRAEVVSVTGHRWAFPLAELQTMLLATHLGDEPLSPGHGAPVRLVAPGRRGFQWIKWVGRIDILS